MKVEYSEEDMCKIDPWQKEQDAKAVEIQKRQFEQRGEEPSEFVKDCWESGFPYAGAIGGEYVLEISFTSLGHIYIMKNKITGEELNLTNYEDW